MNTFNIIDNYSETVARLKKLESHLYANIRGQNHAIKRIFESIKRGELGLTSSRRPKASLLFLGPTGVGKTELTLQFSNFLFGEHKLFRFDMSEFKDLKGVEEFRGTPGGEHGRLGNILSQHNHGTLLFDEMEKAHREILDLFLQMMDAARITLANGDTYDLSGFYIVLTSNVGAKNIINRKVSGFSALEDAVNRELRRQFRPEFLARFTDRILFNRLETDIQIEIANIVLDHELYRMKQKGITLLYQPDGELLNFLVRKGVDIKNGARPLRNCIENYIQQAVCDKLMNLDNPNGYLEVDPVKHQVYIRNQPVNQGNLKPENEAVQARFTWTNNDALLDQTAKGNV